MTMEEQVSAFQKIYESEWFKNLIETSFKQNPKTKTGKDNKGMSLMSEVLGVTHTWVNTLNRFAYKTQKQLVDMVYGGKLPHTAVTELEKFFGSFLIWDSCMGPTKA